MLTTYFSVYYLIPKVLLLKKYLLFTLYLAYTIIFSTYLIILSIFGGFVFLSHLKVANMPPMSRNIVFVMILVYIVVGIVSFVSLLNNNFNNISKNKALENKVLEGQLQLKNQELTYLKKQIHPHFLFNTLNTIYGFALRKSEQTPEIIIKLSNLLDYILYQVQKPKVSLQEELLHIEEYISLEKIRFQDSLQLSFSKSGLPNDLEIPPMLFIPFVENAFKHGNIVNGSLDITIDVKHTDHTLVFSIRNSIIDKVEIEKQGIGLENIRKRLDLLYPNAYTLDIKTFSNYFDLRLLIDTQFSS